MLFRFASKRAKRERKTHGPVMLYDERYISRLRFGSTGRFREREQNETFSIIECVRIGGERVGRSESARSEPAGRRGAREREGARAQSGAGNEEARAFRFTTFEALSGHRKIYTRSKKKRKPSGGRRRGSRAAHSTVLCSTQAAELPNSEHTPFLYSIHSLVGSLRPKTKCGCYSLNIPFVHFIYSMIFFASLFLSFLLSSLLSSPFFSVLLFGSILLIQSDKRTSLAASISLFSYFYFSPRLSPYTFICYYIGMVIWGTCEQY